MKPPRNEGESREDWIARLAEWEASPEGIALAAEAAANERASEARLHEMWMRDAGVPKKFTRIVFHSKLLETPSMRVVVERGDYFVQVLWGGQGTGKTVAAAHWLRGLSEAEALFVEAPRLARWDRYDNEQMNMLLDAERLVIDDMGTEFMDAKGNFMVILDEVISRRVADERLTLITTNLTRDAFLERYGERIASRMREDGRFYGVGADDMRQKKPRLV